MLFVTIPYNSGRRYVQKACSSGEFPKQHPDFTSRWTVHCKPRQAAQRSLAGTRARLSDWERTYTAREHPEQESAWNAQQKEEEHENSYWRHETGTGAMKQVLYYTGVMKQLTLWNTFQEKPQQRKISISKTCAGPYRRWGATNEHDLYKGDWEVSTVFYWQASQPSC